MKYQPIRYERERSYPMSVAEAWRLLADTDHLNRAIGLPSVEFSTLPDPLVRAARARAFGAIPVRWHELPFDWIRERRYAVRREFEGGPIAVIVVGIELQPAPEGVTVRSYAEYTPANAAGRLVWRLARKSVTDLLDFCDHYLRRKEAGRADPVPVPRARPAVNRALLDQRLGQLTSAEVRPELTGLLKERILAGSDDQLTGIRPFVLADRWAIDRLAVLRLFLHATAAGLFQLRWELMCPNCRVPKAESDTLARLPVQFHCDTCGISYDADLDQRVELRFTVHPAIRRADAAVYCIGGPLRTPHVVAQQYIWPHEDRPVDLDLTGPVQLRTVRAVHRLLLTPGPAGSRARDITITYSGGRWVGPHSLTSGDNLTVPGGSRLVLRNQTSGPILAAIDDPAWTGEATSAAQVTTLQDFRGLFSSEVLAPRQQLAVSHIAFLFSDLKGSTQLYEGIGDAAAYSRVARHFDFIRQAVGRGGGSVIKTMGDGVMCAFYRLDDALTTAIRLQGEVAAWCRDQGIDPPLALKIGVHHGPAIAMTANDHLDYFGRTVNLAARVAGQSRGGDVVVLREVLDQADQSAWPGRGGIGTESFTARLRGLDQDQRLVRLLIAGEPSDRTAPDPAGEARPVPPQVGLASGGLVTGRQP
jgi:class 3 adenylate cyclase